MCAQRPLLVLQNGTGISVRAGTGDSQQRPRGHASGAHPAFAAHSISGPCVTRLRDPLQPHQILDVSPAATADDPRRHVVAATDSGLWHRWRAGTFRRLSSPSTRSYTMRWIDQLIFNDSGLIPVVTQEATSGEVLMLAFANRTAVERTMETGRAHYWSRSRNALWQKGETSGHVQEIVEVRADCDADSLLYLVRQTGPACHTGEHSCFHRLAEGDQLSTASATGHILSRLEEIVRARHVERPAGSYTTYLFERGIDKILKKVGEEATEVVIAAKNDSGVELRAEAADLLFHLLVLMRARSMPLSEVWQVLETRFGSKSRLPRDAGTDHPNS